MSEESCPRCGSDKSRVISKSPVEGVWKLFVCDSCKYVWRDTENKEELTPDFDGDPEELEKAVVVPPIPEDIKKKLERE